MSSDSQTPLWTALAQTPTGRYKSIRRREHSAVNRVVAGKVQPGEPKDVTINSWCWWRRGSTPRPRGLCSLRADFAIRSRIAPSLVLSPKSGAFRRPLLPNTEVKPCSAENSALATECEDRKMPTLDSEYFLYKELYEIKTCCMASLFSLLKNSLFWIPYGKKEQMDIL